MLGLLLQALDAEEADSAFEVPRRSVLDDVRDGGEAREVLAGPERARAAEVVERDARRAPALAQHQLDVGSQLVRMKPGLLVVVDERDPLARPRFEVERLDGAGEAIARGGEGADGSHCLMPLSFLGPRLSRPRWRS